MATKSNKDLIWLAMIRNQITLAVYIRGNRRRNSLLVEKRLNKDLWSSPDHYFDEPPSPFAYFAVNSAAADPDVEF